MADPNDKALIKAVKVLRAYDNIEDVAKFLQMITDGYKVVRVSSLHYQVAKPNQDAYSVVYDNKTKKPSCNCPARKKCKHIAFMDFLGLFLPQMVTAHE